MTATLIRPVVGINDNAAPNPVTMFQGKGVPDFAAAKGSLYVATDASATNTRLYVNTDGDTTWASFTASA